MIVAHVVAQQKQRRTCVRDVGGSGVIDVARDVAGRGILESCD